MSKRAVLIGAGLVAFACLVGAGVAFVLLVQGRGSSLPFLRSLTVQEFAQNLACTGSSHAAPGSYHDDQPQTVGDYLVVAYTVVCDAPGQPGQAFGGYLAQDTRGGRCGGSSSLITIPPSASGPVTIYLESASQCRGTGGSSGLSVIAGFITGPGVVSAQVLFGAGDPASAPLRSGRFVVIAPNDNGICALRALDASGAVLAEKKLGQAGAKRVQGACP